MSEELFIILNLVDPDVTKYEANYTTAEEKFAIWLRF